MVAAPRPHARAAAPALQQPSDPDFVQRVAEIVLPAALR
jgi:hypothetical protein